MLGLGLGAYGSSSEDEAPSSPHRPQPPEARNAPSGVTILRPASESRPAHLSPAPATGHPAELDQRPVLGPSLPAADAAQSALAEPDDEPDAATTQLAQGAPDGSDPAQPPPSSSSSPPPPPPPAAATAADELRRLTMPPVQDWAIPPSPPGSPPAADSARFARFLDAKKTGQHFNEKLAQNSALKNPGLFLRLLDHVGLPPDAQYASTLPPDLWDPLRDLPRWGRAAEQSQRQQEVGEARAAAMKREGRSEVQFVSARGSAGGARMVSD
ncbi:hypothetical protein KEM52_000058 [Ascosphaera acerosa]|nr:hypothetical protein KEM52_000058 [Ascosphaera acerosa]